jgi:hypothetical protein
MKWHSNLAEAIMSLICPVEVPVSCLSHGTGYSDLGSSCFFSEPLDSYQDYTLNWPGSFPT